MPSLPTKCNFCRKEQTEGRRLMLTASTFGAKMTNSICSDCVGIQMTVLAGWDSELFETLVEWARIHASAFANIEAEERPAGIGSPSVR